MQDEEDDIDQDYNLTKPPFNPMDNYLGSEHETTPVIKNQPMLHDPLLRYVTETKYLIDSVPTKEGVTSENSATEALPEQSLSSSTSSSLETEDKDDNTVQEQVDEEYLEQMEVDYKSTEGAQEDIGGVSETYHPIPHLDEDRLLSGEVMDAYPRMESTLLADTTKPTAEAGFLASGHTATAASALANPDMLTSEEFLGVPELEDAQAGDDEDREESPASFDTMSHWTPKLPTPKKKPAL